MTDRIDLLFVCTANICRSLYAEGRACQLLGNTSSIGVASAGTFGLTNRPLDADLADELAARGDVPDLRSQRLNGALLRATDVVLTAESAHRTFILEEWPTASERVFTFNQFAEALTRTPTRLWPRDTILAAFEARGPVRKSGDIPDPYRRGPSAAASTARLIDNYLAAILPRLRSD